MESVENSLFLLKLNICRGKATGTKLYYNKRDKIEKNITFAFNII